METSIRVTATASASTVDAMAPTRSRFILHYQVIDGQPNTIRTNCPEEELRQRYPFLRDGWYSHHPTSDRSFNICAHCCAKKDMFIIDPKHVDPGTILNSYGPDVVCPACVSNIDGPFITAVHYVCCEPIGCIIRGTYLSDIPMTQKVSIDSQLRIRVHFSATIERMHTLGSRDEMICADCCTKRLGSKRYELGHNSSKNGNCCRCEKEYDAAKKECIP